jgi:hypothetical protein
MKSLKNDGNIVKKQCSEAEKNRNADKIKYKKRANYEKANNYLSHIPRLFIGKVEKFHSFNLAEFSRFFMGQGNIVKIHGPGGAG